MAGTEAPYVYLPSSPEHNHFLETSDFSLCNAAAHSGIVYQNHQVLNMDKRGP